MTTLARVLIDYDLGLLRVMAELWGLELRPTPQRDTAEQLAAHILHTEVVREMVAALAPEVRAALEALYQAKRILFATFQRTYGELRAMGPARRDREQPWLNAPSATEQLWYRGLLARGFFSDENGATQEYAYIPGDVARLLPPPAPAIAPPPGNATEPPSTFRSLQWEAVEDATTLLAYWQLTSVKLERGVWPERHRAAIARFLRQPERLDFITHLLLELHLAGSSPAGSGPLKPDSAKARAWLESGWGAQAHSLAEAWRNSTLWNDLRYLPGLIFEGTAWSNDPVATRQTIFNHLANVPAGEWWALDSFVQAVKQRTPDFQRPAGDYDSWYIRDPQTNDYLRGFEHWERIDGALIRYVLTGPLLWLGLVEATAAATAFRLTPNGAACARHAEFQPRDSQAAWHLAADGMVHVPASASAYQRFQMARVGNWVPPETEAYVYRLSPGSLARATRQNIAVGAIITFLQKAVGGELPAKLIIALRRWERAGAEVTVSETVMLKVTDAALLATLRRDPTLAPLLGEALSDTVIEVKGEGLETVRMALAELGILAD